MKRKALLSLVLVTVWGCSSSDGAPDSRGAGGSGSSTGTDGTPGAGGSSPGSGGTSGEGTGATSSGATSGGGAAGTDTTVVFEEADLCSYSGALETEHTGFAGDGYVNTANAIGSSITWSVASSGGAGTLSFRYASLDARPAKVLVDGEDAGTLDFAATADWATWSDASLPLTLPAGETTVTLEATTAAGLANIDSLSITGSGVEVAECPVPTGAPNVFATASGTVEVWVNGTNLGSTTATGALLSGVGTFVPGQQNIIAIRATKGAAGNPALLAELDGVFGRAGTSNLWKAKAAASSDELTGNAWAQTAFDDASWALAKDVSVKPTAAELTSGPAKGIWSSAASDGTVVFRLRLYIPAGWSANTPVGFAKDTTGGAGGEVVTVTTPAQLSAAVGGTTARVIRIPGVIDFRGTQGSTSESACWVGDCQQGAILGSLGACEGKSTFNVNVDQAGPNPLVIGSNKTLVGVGPNAAILGKGLKFTKEDSTNIIIRNLTISEINAHVVWGGDGLSIFGSNKLWFDHNKISLVGRQFICAAYEANTNLTFSFNEFDGRTPYSATCNGATYWVAFLMGAGDTITSFGNWYHHTSGRNPDIASTAMHSVNDYFDTVPGHLAEMWETATLLYEGTYFRNVDTVFGANHSGFLFAPLASTVSSVNSACSSALGRSCVANATNRSANEATFTLDQSVLSTFSAHKQYLATPFPANEVPNCVPHLAGPGHI